MSILNVDYSYRVFVTLLKRLKVNIQLQVVFCIFFFSLITTYITTAGYDDIIVTQKLIRFEDLSYLVRLRE